MTGRKMAAQHCVNAPETAAKGGCYICTNPNDVVAFDAVIEGEGVLVLCSACLFDAAAVARIGHARLVKANKHDEQVRKARGAA
jgi:hypothetical protein